MHVVFTFTGRFETQRIGARRLRCARYEGMMTGSKGESSRVVQWRNDEVPGGVVRNESYFTVDGAEQSHVLSLEDFGLGGEERAGTGR